MREASVDADGERRIRQQRCDVRQRQPRGEHGLRVAFREPAAARFLRSASPGQHDGESGVAASIHHRAPMRLRPQLVVAARRVQHDDVRPVRRAGPWRRHAQVPARRRVGRIVERCTGELPAARDEVQVSRNAVMDVVEECCERLANARPVEAVPHAARRAGDQRAFHLLLKVEDRGIPRLAQRVAKRIDVAPRGSREWRASPPAQSERDHAAYVGAKRDQGREAGLGNPVDCKVRMCAPDVGNDRQRIDDIAKRRRPNDEHAARRCCGGAAHPAGSVCVAALIAAWREPRTRRGSDSQNT
jgi:hypothetical protein